MKSKNIYKKLIDSAVMLMVVFSISSMFAITSPAMTTTANAACNERILTFPAWYRGLVDGNCNVKPPVGDRNDGKGLSDFIWRIALNVIESLLQIVGYLCAGYIILGGYKYLTSTGTPDGMARAKSTIQNAVIGLIISISSVAIVNLIAGAM